MKRLKYCLAVAFLAAGCATKPIEVPHVFIPGAPPDAVRSALVQREIPKGWTLDRESQSELVFGRPLKSFGAMLVFGSNYDREPRLRFHCTLSPENGGTHVYFSAEIVTNPGSAFERVTPNQNPKQLEIERQALEEIRVSLAK